MCGVMTQVLRVLRRFPSGLPRLLSVLLCSGTQGMLMTNLNSRAVVKLLGTAGLTGLWVSEPYQRPFRGRFASRFIVVDPRALDLIK
jgi:hypothetical protein